MKHWLALCVLIFLVVFPVSGCSSVPFQKPASVSMEQENPATVRERFKQRLPLRYSLLNTITFKFNPFKKKQISALGSITVDTSGHEFTAVCINPLGVKLFEIFSNSHETTSRFAIGELAKKQDLAKAVAADIKRVYFDLVPSTEAETKNRRYRIDFKEPSREGKMLYERS